MTICDNVCAYSQGRATTSNEQHVEAAQPNGLDSRMDSVTPPELEAAFGYSAREVDYLCNIGASRSFLYFEIPKAGCSSIKRTLQLLELPSLTVLQANVHDKAVSPLEGPLSSGMSFAEIFQSQRLFRFALVRNPYCRALSCYLDKIVAESTERQWHQHLLGFEQEEPISFRKFLLAIHQIDDRSRDMHWRSQAGLINDRRIHYHYLGAFEHFRRDLSYALEQIGCDQAAEMLQDVRAHRTDAAGRLQEFFGDAELTLVQQIYRVDFLRYGYSLELPHTSNP
jgi:hypothetical protein